MSTAAVTKTAISHISVVTVHVKDQDEALRFYTEILGFEKRDDAPMSEDMRWLTVAPAGSTTQILLATGSAGTGAPLGSNTVCAATTQSVPC